MSGNRFKKSQETIAHEQPVTPAASPALAQTETVGDLLSSFHAAPKKPAKKTYTYYLEVEVAEGLERMADRMGTSVSPLVNHILKAAIDNR